VETPSLGFEVSLELGCWSLELATLDLSAFDEKSHKVLAMARCDL